MKGHIQQVGPPENLYNKPNNTFVAEFVGAPPITLIDAAELDGFGGGKSLGLRAEGETVGINFHNDNLHVFDGAGNRMTPQICGCFSTPPALVCRIKSDPSLACHR